MENNDIMSNSTTLYQSFVDGYNDILTNKRDRRVDGWPLAGSPFPTIILCISYVCFVKVLGPMYMKNRPPFKLKKLIILYNAIQVYFSLSMFYQFGAGGWFQSYSWRCQPVDYSQNPEAMTMARAVWWYFLSKFVDFIDTVFLVLTKKDQQITYLHVIHHGTMPLTIWIGVKFAAGGHGTLVGLVNSLVHAVMYSYYMVAAMGPKYKQYIWWKKYLTNFQMVQFVVTFVHAMQLFLFECNYPKILAWWVVYHSVLFLTLFANYYRQTQMKLQKNKII